MSENPLRSDDSTYEAKPRKPFTFQTQVGPGHLVTASTFGVSVSTPGAHTICLKYSLPSE